MAKSHPNFQHFVKKIEAHAKKWFSYKKTCTCAHILNTYEKIDFTFIIGM